MSALDIAAVVIQLLAPVAAGYIAGRIHGSLDILTRLFTRGSAKEVPR